LSPKPSSRSLAFRDSPATLGLEMSEKPSNGAASILSRSAAMMANNAHKPRRPRVRGVETAHHERLSEENKRLSSKKPIMISGFPPILERFLMVSIRWTLFRIFPFSSASIRVHPRPNDFSQDPREWLCFEKCRPTRCLEAPPPEPRLGITVNYSKESQ